MPDTLVLRQRIARLEQLAADVDGLLRDWPLNELRGCRLLLTGATGFVGRWLLLACKCLNENGTPVKVTALSRDPHGFLADAPEWRDMPWLNWIAGDIRDFAFPDAPVDAILHGATDTSAEFAASHGDELHDSMVRGTEHVMRLAAQYRARVLLLSSGAVYGEQPAEQEALSEEFVALRDNDPTPYGRGKREVETIAWRYAETHDVDSVIARGFTFVGFGLADHLAISQFIRDAQENRIIAVKGDGQTIRSYLYAADMAVWLLTLLARGRSQQAYNVGSPQALTLLALAQRVQALLAPDTSVVTLNADRTEVRRRYVPDTRRAELELGLRAWTPLDQAIVKTAEANRLRASRR